MILDMKHNDPTMDSTLWHEFASFKNSSLDKIRKKCIEVKGYLFYLLHYIKNRMDWVGYVKRGSGLQGVSVSETVDWEAVAGSHPLAVQRQHLIFVAVDVR